MGSAGTGEGINETVCQSQWTLITADSTAAVFARLIFL